MIPEEIKKYLSRKNLGGKINRDGNSYENFFAVYCITELIEDYIQSHSISHISTQIKGFVDDLFIEQGNKHQYYQLKSSRNLKWTSGKKSVEFDFMAQKEYFFRKDCFSTLNLVVAFQTLAMKLKDSMPSNLSSCTNVIYFPFYKSISSQLIKDPDFRKSLMKICSFSDQDKLESLANVILGIWVGSSGDRISISDIAEKAEKINYSFIKQSRLLPVSDHLVCILNKIPGFQYSIQNGYLTYYFGKNDKGIIPYPVNSEKFRNIEEIILSRDPKTFSELEELI